MKRQLGIALMLTLLCACNPSPAPPATLTHCGEWPQWTAFHAQFMDGGRIVDRNSADSRSTSEGQAYALFFALVANDQIRFDRLLQWTQDNLAGGDLTARLPAWLWGRDKNGEWGILDDNPATDADLWLAYALQQAGHLWSRPELLASSQLVAQRLLRESIATVPDIGPVLLPAPKGFADAQGWRINPSYIMPLITYALAQDDAQWQSVHQTQATLLINSLVEGFPTDWARIDQTGTLSSVAQHEAEGSFDAIRVYLWAGISAPSIEPVTALRRRLNPVVEHLRQHGTPPLQLQDQSGVGPAGFSAALLPYLNSIDAADAFSQQHARIKARHPDMQGRYYTQALTTFALGHIDGYYRFDSKGRLLRPKARTCVAASTTLH